MTTLSLKTFEAVILSEDSCHSISCSACNYTYFFSQLEINHVLNGPTHNSQKPAQMQRIFNKCKLDIRQANKNCANFHWVNLLTMTWYLKQVK